MNQIALIIGSIMIALGLIAAAVVPLVAQEEPTPTPTEGIVPSNMTGVAEGTTENQSEMSPATKR